MTKVQKQFNGGKIAFSTYGAGAIRQGKNQKQKTKKQETKKHFNLNPINLDKK